MTRAAPSWLRSMALARSARPSALWPGTSPCREPGAPARNSPRAGLSWHSRMPGRCRPRSRNRSQTRSGSSLRSALPATRSADYDCDLEASRVADGEAAARQGDLVDVSVIVPGRAAPKQAPVTARERHHPAYPALEDPRTGLDAPPQVRLGAVGSTEPYGLRTAGRS